MGALVRSPPDEPVPESSPDPLPELSSVVPALLDPMLESSPESSELRVAVALLESLSSSLLDVAGEVVSSGAITTRGGGLVLTDCAAAYAAVPRTATDSAATAMDNVGLRTELAPGVGG